MTPAELEGSAVWQKQDATTGESGLRCVDVSPSQPLVRANHFTAHEFLKSYPGDVIPVPEPLWSLKANRYMPSFENMEPGHAVKTGPMGDVNF